MQAYYSILGNTDFGSMSILRHLDELYLVTADRIGLLQTGVPHEAVLSPHFWPRAPRTALPFADRGRMRIPTIARMYSDLMPRSVPL